MNIWFFLVIQFPLLLILQVHSCVETYVGNKGRQKIDGNFNRISIKYLKRVELKLCLN